MSEAILLSHTYLFLLDVFVIKVYSVHSAIGILYQRADETEQHGHLFDTRDLCPPFHHCLDDLCGQLLVGPVTQKTHEQGVLG